MLFRIDPGTKVASATPTSRLSELGYQERYDLQEWVISNPTILGEELFVVTDEYAGFDRTRERLDILALDRAGKLVVVELKRSAAGTHAELQAIRYAAYCSTLQLHDVAEIHTEFRTRRGEVVSLEEALHRIVDFVEDPDFAEIDDKPRMILGAEEFPAEITASVMWLRGYDIDIRCVRLRPYSIGEHLVLEASVLIPLPEAEEYVIRRERKELRVAQQAKEDVVSPEGQALQLKVLDGLRGSHGFSDKAPTKGAALWFRNIGDYSYLGLIRTKNQLRVELYIDEGDWAFNRRILAALEHQKAELAEEVGCEPEWRSGGKSRKSSVVVIRLHNPGEDVQEPAEWAVDKLQRFYSAFAPRVRSALAEVRGVETVEAADVAE